MSRAVGTEASVSTLLILAGREDPEDGQTFRGVILAQIDLLNEGLEAPA